MEVLQRYLSKIMGNICSKHRRRNRNYQVSSTQSTPERKHELDEGGSSQYADRKACQLKVTVSEKTYQGWYASILIVSPLSIATYGITVIIIIVTLSITIMGYNNLYNTC